MPDSPFVAVVGSGPVGLALGARLRAAGHPFVILEAGPHPAPAVREWGHIRMFSPWSWNVDRVAAELLTKGGWRHPGGDALPTGAELRERYLAPLAQSLAANVRCGFDVISITASGGSGPGFELQSASGERLRARFVVDASGVWRGKNGLGPDGARLKGEEACRAVIAYGPTDVLSRPDIYAGKTVLVVGGGHSGMHAALDLSDIPGGGETLWASRCVASGPVAGNDKFPGRAALHDRAAEAVRRGAVISLAPFVPVAIRRTATGVRVRGDTEAGPRTVEAQRVIVATGFRPDLAMLRSAGGGFDPVLECPKGLAPIIRSRSTCGEFPDFNVAALGHPAHGLFTAGIKSFGRATNFDLQVGYRQADLIARAISG